MNIATVRRLERLEAAKAPQGKDWIVVSQRELIPAGFDGRAIVTDVPRHSEAA